MILLQFWLQVSFFNRKRRFSILDTQKIIHDNIIDIIQANYMASFSFSLVSVTLVIELFSETLVP